MGRERGGSRNSGLPAQGVGKLVSKVNHDPVCNACSGTGDLSKARKPGLGTGQKEQTLNPKLIAMRSVALSSLAGP